MWEVEGSLGSFTIEKCVTGIASFVYSENGRVYKTPYRIEAQQIADELNGESNASN